MPNHTQTILTILGDSDEIQRFINDVNGESYSLEFSKVYPISDPEDWYNWCTTNWGTKWGAYNVGYWYIKKNTASITYQTAWSPATAFYLHVSKSYNLQFKHEFADEGEGFLGSETIKNGEIINENELEWNSPAGEALKYKLGIEDYYSDKV